MGRIRNLVAAAALSLVGTTAALAVPAPAQAASGGSTFTSSATSTVSTQNGHMLTGHGLPAPHSMGTSFGFLSFFQEATTGSLNISIDGGASTALTQGGFIYGLIPAGVHNVTASNGNMPVASGNITIAAGENWTSLVYLAHPVGGYTISGFLNNRTPPGIGNSRIVMRNAAYTPPVDIYINGQLSPQGTNLVNESTNPPSAGSVPIAAGPVSIVVKPHGSMSTIAQAGGNLVSGDLLNIFLVSDTTAPGGFSLLTNANPLGAGYRLYASDGGTFNYGSAYFNGSLGGSPINKPVVGASPTAIGLGYWMVASDGGVFAFGDAGFYGSMGGTHLNQPIVGIASTPDGLGYWMVAADGGIFAFGDARFYGSTGSTVLNRPIVGIAPTIDGNGYWLVASDGGIFAFGDASFFGSMGGKHLNKPIVSAFTTPDSLGYWLVASDGGVFSFGNAGFFGSTGNINLNQPIVAGTNPGVPVPTS